jgi:hypothetical protein
LEFSSGSALPRITSMSMSRSLGLDEQSKTDLWLMVWEDLLLVRESTSSQDRLPLSKKSAAKAPY